MHQPFLDKGDHDRAVEARQIVVALDTDDVRIAGPQRAQMPSTPTAPDGSWTRMAGSGVNPDWPPPISLPPKQGRRNVPAGPIDPAPRSPLTPSIAPATAVPALHANGLGPVA
jgi:hypothetical protein